MFQRAHSLFLPRNSWATKQELLVEDGRQVSGAAAVQGGDRTLPSGNPEVPLALVLCGVAGALNAGGFMLIEQYTSHMTGIISAIADNAAVGAWHIVGAGLVALCSFLAGASCAAVLINWGRRHRHDGYYRRPLLLEATLLIVFGLTVPFLHEAVAAATTIPLLCFLMGLQNATITKQSGARLRTTHMTGIATDIGIEVGKLFYWNRGPGALIVRADRHKLRLLSGQLGCFLFGGVIGAFSFAKMGVASSVPLALVLLGAAWLLPLPDDKPSGSQP